VTVRGQQHRVEVGAGLPLEQPVQRVVGGLHRPQPEAEPGRLAALVPPPRANLVRYFGVFAPNARLRPSVVPAPPSLPVSSSNIRIPRTVPSRFGNETFDVGMDNGSPAGELRVTVRLFRTHQEGGHPHRALGTQRERVPASPERRARAALVLE
jgi:hypothetical protein